MTEGNGWKHPGGRPKGRKNNSTLLLEREARETELRMKGMLPESIKFEGDALAFFQAIYQDASLAHPIRVEAATKAIAYERVKLTANYSKVEHGGTIEVQDARQTLERLIDSRATKEPKGRSLKRIN